MSFQWTQHRFSGGALALDVANSVIHRFDAARREDRFAEPVQLADFARAASEMGRERDAHGALAPVDAAGARRLLALREAVDAYFRQRSLGGDDNGLLARLLGVAAEIVGAYAETDTPCPVDLAAARSAIALLAPGSGERMKICPNCQWLFVDFSRNGSRTWCDMAVCGNRAKARLHYRRKREGAA